MQYICNGTKLDIHKVIVFYEDLVNIRQRGGKIDLIGNSQNTWINYWFFFYSPILVCGESTTLNASNELLLWCVLLSYVILGEVEVTTWFGV